MAGRAFSRDEEKQIQDQFTRNGTNTYKVSSNFVPFEGKADLQDADRFVSDLLKDIFQRHLPRVEADEDDPMNMVKNDDAEDNENDLFGGQQEQQPERESKKRRLRKGDESAVQEPAEPVATKDE